MWDRTLQNNDKNRTLDNLCVAPWVSLYMNPGGSISPCCMNTEIVGLSKGKLLEDLNCTGLSQVRKEFLSNQIPKGCEVCFLEEKHGKRSTRKRMESLFPNEDAYIDSTLSDGTIPHPKIKYLDVRWSNVCNFKCRFCSHGLSSSWAAELLQEQRSFHLPGHGEGPYALRDIKTPILKSEVDYMHLENQILPYVEQIQFLGGEPLLMEEFYFILTRLLEKGRTNVRIAIVSNLSQLSHNGHHLFEVLKNFPNVSFSASLDGFGKRAEYMRKGTVWEEIIENLPKVIDFFSKEQRFFQILHTVYALNAFHTVDFYEMIQKIFGCNITLNFCHNPFFYRLDVLPPKVKVDLLNTYSKYPEFYKPLISHLEEDLKNNFYYKTHYADFLKNVKKIDLVRNENFSQIFPEFSPYSLFDETNLFLST